MPFHCSQLPNNAASDKFTSNLRRLFETISEVAGKDAYNKTTEGRYPDKVYGLYLCRGDVNNESCGECVDLATDTIQKDCDGTKEAVIWSDKCMVRYSDRSITLGAVASAMGPAVEKSSKVCGHAIVNLKLGSE